MGQCTEAKKGMDVSERMGDPAYLAEQRVEATSLSARELISRAGQTPRPTVQNRGCQWALAIAPSVSTY